MTHNNLINIQRSLAKTLASRIEQNKNILLLGPRQTGKTTLLNEFSADLTLSLIVPRMRMRYEANPSLLIDEIELLAEKTKNRLPLIIIDEIQKVPLLMDAVQDLVDRKKAQFILTGSSARQLKHGQHINLLPGRVIPLYMDPLNLSELNASHLPYTLENLITYGSLPQVFLSETLEDKEELLNAYVSLYLEEEIRAEAVVRRLGHFARFLELAAAESGYLVNHSKLSQEIGVAHTTIASYYTILEDCLIVERIEPFLKTKTRRKLSKAPKYLFFDLGVRRLAANENQHPPVKYQGHLFEQWVGLELIRAVRALPERIKIHYWRDLSGIEVDWIIDKNGALTPIEVKWTDTPSLQDAKHLMLFLNEHDEAKTGYIICQTPHAIKLADNIIALPWKDLLSVFGS